MQARPPRWFREVFPPILLIGLSLLSWQVIASRSGLSAFILPSPIDVMQAGWATREVLGNAVLTTLMATMVGLFLITSVPDLFGEDVIIGPEVNFYHYMTNP